MNKKQELKNQATCETCGRKLKVREGHICDKCLKKWEKMEE